ncbi:MAG: hypothetical protein FWG27_00340 [Treponema sp.]|nr:hypothetical protein [Treponema sp.]
MKPPFRPVSFWQSALMTLPDAAFFDLLRSILGAVKTPFNKQNLIGELSRFIVRSEIQETMAAYIDDNDRRIIAAIALLREPVPGELESFFTGEYSYAELQSMLLNLEERLIIYRFRDNDALRIALNPRLENILAPHAGNTGILFPALSPASLTVEDSTMSAAANEMLNGRTLAALFSFLLGSEIQIKDEAGKTSLVFRKKTTEQSKVLFPGLDINAVAGGLLALGLLVRERGLSTNIVIAPDEAKMAAFKALTDQNRFEYLAGGIALFLHHGASVAPQGRGMLKNTVYLIHSLCSAAKDGRILPEATMIKMAELFRRQEQAGWGFFGELPSAAVLIRSLVMAGLFTAAVIDGTTYYCPVTANVPDQQRPHIAMDSGFSCILYPEISFADALDLAAFSTVEETGTAIHFALSRDSVVRGFDRGYDADFLWQLLERLSGGRAPEALKWNLGDWEKRWQEVSLNEGVVLTLSGERSYLAQTEPLASMIKRTLAPGIYLLSANKEDATDALHCAGVDIVARPGSKISVLSTFFSPLGEAAGNVNPPPGSIKELAEQPENGEIRVLQIKDRFFSALKQLKLNRQEQEELESRIERRIVVSESQLKDASLRYEKLEARSLDYVGKTGIVKQAIISGSLLELSCLNGEKILGVPESLDKKGSEMILVIKPRDGGESIKLALGKISLIRRIKQSIFGV